MSRSPAAERLRQRNVRFKAAKVEKRGGGGTREADVNVHAPISVASPKWVRVIPVHTAWNSDSIRELTKCSGIGTYEGQLRRHQAIKK